MHLFVCPPWLAPSPVLEFEVFSYLLICRLDVVNVPVIRVASLDFVPQPYWGVVF